MCSSDLNGDTYPCELLTDRRLGNVRDVGYDFKKIWFSKEADEARAFIRDSKCFCTYECFLTVNILFNPRMLLSVFKEWAILKGRRYGRRLFGRRTAAGTSEDRRSGARPASVAADGTSHLPPRPPGAASGAAAGVSLASISLPVIDADVGLKTQEDCCRHADMASDNA